MARIGIFGGTFNPIHFGHLRAALEVHERFEFHQTLVVPAAIPPHKGSREIASAQDRLEMIRLAVADIPQFAVADIELQRPGPSYTVDTIRQFRAEGSAGTQLFLVLGMDAVVELDTWKSFPELLELTDVVAVARPGAHEDTAGRLGGFLRERISDAYRYDPSTGAWVHPEKRSVYFFEGTAMNISSTLIRELVKAGRSVRFLVPSQVQAYITDRGLYR